MWDIDLKVHENYLCVWNEIMSLNNELWNLISIIQLDVSGELLNLRCYVSKFDWGDDCVCLVSPINMHYVYSMKEGGG